ncbi:MULTISPECIES: hypothetical protein [unclassified Uliginosibacterium]|jgi:hypothetical protein|uniref:hypothetical protein n=1 Tax=unclassified Uliginosibacterium TaxID=2621521 RepID=UPI000C7C8562|nr:MULTISPECIES: hypothetical protein [unclassified Uliginosibacterium]MDO6386705.1 hypothetical protein [Uliginosibacterium sp. 31-12]PLK50532.1 hypothetical protein C0V76_01535 [Uliginosibacterium sp. TH139]
MPSSHQRGAALLILALILGGLILLVTLYTWIALSYNYSDGERAGYVQKLSRKGWVCKTWEGDLALVNLPGQPAEIFQFSVRDDAIAEQINKLVGKRVALTYEQHIGLPTTCFGETQYFVTAIQAVE